MPSFNIDAEFEVYCNSCGRGICGNYSEKRNLNNVFNAEPCENCIDTAEKDGAESRQDEIDGLEQEIANLKDQISQGEKR